MDNGPVPAFRYLAPTEIVFGAGTFRSLREHSRRLGARPLVVTGRRFARVSGLLDAALEQLAPRRGAAVFDQVPENPDTSVCDAAAAYCRDRACDHVVAIGGGSAMDVAKAVAGLARNKGGCADYFGADKFSGGALPVLAVPTTAGTGSEVTPYAVIVDARDRTKRTVSGRSLFPAAALLDPDLTRTMPREVAIATGLDALSQAMEGIVSKKSTPLGDTLALDACRRIRRYLPRAANDPGDDEARAQMLYAAMLGGCVIAQSGTTLVHGMGYHYTLARGIAHGLANALLLAPVFAHNARYAPDKVAAIAAALGEPPSEPGPAVVAAIYRLLQELGVSPAARDHGVKAEDLEAFARDVAADPYRYRNQIGEITEARILGFYSDSHTGTHQLA